MIAAFFAWVSKSGLNTDPDTQALEDAAVLVFLEHKIGARHADYPRDKFVDILHKTWLKLSPAAQQAASTLALPPGITAHVHETTGSA